MNAWGMGVDRFRLGGAGLVGGGWRNAAAAGWRFCRVEAGGIVGNFFFCVRNFGVARDDGWVAYGGVS